MKPAQQRKQLVEQLRKTPIVQVACQKLGVARATYYRWRADDPAFANEADVAIADGELVLNDLAESQLVAAIQERNIKAITFWLRHHHARYGTKLEISGFVEARGALTPEQEQMVRRALELTRTDNDETDG